MRLQLSRRLAFVAAIQGCGSTQISVPMQSRILRQSNLPTVFLSSSEVLSSLRTSIDPIMEETLMDSEHLSPPPLVAGEPYLFEKLVNRRPLTGTLSDSNGELVDIYRSMTWFRLRSDLKRSVFVVNRWHDDFNRDAVGIFVRSWTDEELVKLQSLVEGIPWTELAEPTDGDYGGSQISIKYKRQSKTVEREFNSHNGGFVAAIGSLLDWTSQRSIESMDRPLAGLQLSVQARPIAQEPGDYSVRVAFLNPGTHPVIFHDPRRPPPGTDAYPRPRLRLRVAPDTNLLSPDWVDLAIPPPRDSDPAMVTLAGGAVFELSATWKSPAPGSYWLSADWADYEPPPKGVKHAPLMPMPADLDEPFSDRKAPYLLMGGTYASEELVVPGRPTR